ncbi:MAG TPA: alpha/beta hydrolase-fold protein [Vicinamibacterales bacterium]|nr:alpha/beta hydrolase-fold protein [Vicinamibacterales bacterium]
MNQRRTCIAILWVLATASGVHASDDAPTVGRVTSAALGAVRDFSVRLPASYAREPRRRYPVIYVLDGPPLDGDTAAGAGRLAASGVAPELIVVGIPNMRRGGRARDFLPPSLSFRRRDGSPFTGGADRFLRFLRDELVPRIDRDYRTKAPRLLVGHSLGAIFVCYSLSAAPALFDARFAHSPAIWRDEDTIVAEVARTLSPGRALGGFFYVSVGAKEGDGMGLGFEKLRALLAARAAAAGLRWRAEVTPGAVHETNVKLATPSALRAYFANSTAQRPPVAP